MADYADTTEAISKPARPRRLVLVVLILAAGLAGLWLARSGSPEEAGGTTAPELPSPELTSTLPSENGAEASPTDTELVDTGSVDARPVVALDTQERLALGEPADTYLAYFDYAERSGVVVDLSDGSVFRVNGTRFDLIQDNWAIGIGGQNPIGPDRQASMTRLDLSTGDLVEVQVEYPPNQIVPTSNPNQIWASRLEGRITVLELMAVPSFEVIETLTLIDESWLVARPGADPLVGTRSSGTYTLSSNASLVSVSPGLAIPSFNGPLLTIECDDRLECGMHADGVLLGPSPAALTRIVKGRVPSLAATQDWIVYSEVDGGLVLLMLETGESVDVGIGLDGRAVLLRDRILVVGEGQLRIFNSDSSEAITTVPISDTAMDELITAWSPRG